MRTPKISKKNTLLIIIMLIGIMFCCGSPAQASQDLSQGASNLTHAYDGSDITSANILTNNGYIIYRLSDLGLTSGSVSKYTVSTKDLSAHNLSLTYLDTNFTVLNSGGRVDLAITGKKSDYTATVPNGAVYVRINGISGTEVYIYEISVGTSITPGKIANSQGANNMADACDGIDTTSGNVITDDGYIIFNLSEIGIASGSIIKLTACTKDSTVTPLSLEYLVYDTATKTFHSAGVTENMTLTRNKTDHITSQYVPAAGRYLRINGIAGTQVYIYEISKANNIPGGPVSTSTITSGKITASHGANNLSDACDGIDTTSGNILTDDGYIIFNLDELGMTSGSLIKLTACTSDSTATPLTLEYMIYDSSTRVFHPTGVSEDMTLTTNKADHVTTQFVPANGHYLKISGIAGTQVYIYEISKANYVPGGPVSAPTIASGKIAASQGANNLSDACDGIDTTSGNILTDDGYIIFNLNELGVASGSLIKLTACTKDSIATPLTLEYLVYDATTKVFHSIGVSESIPITVNKADHITTQVVPANGLYVKINAIPGTQVYIYEIVPGGAITPVSVSSITITGAGGATTVANGDTLQINKAVLPANATNKTVAWSVTNGTGSATISTSGLLSATGVGDVTVNATANDGSSVVGTLVITITPAAIPSVAVTSIAVTGAGGATTVANGGTLQMNAAVLPAGATNKTVAWSVTNGTGSATISAGGLLSATGVGNVTVNATANDGSSVIGTLVITITPIVPLVAAASITITGAGGATSVANSGTLQMNAAVLPVNATNQNVTWSVTNGTGSATISPGGLLTATGTGTVTVKATAVDGSYVIGTLTITITDTRLAKINASQLRAGSGARYILSDVLTTDFGLTATGTQLTEIVYLFYFNYYNYQNGFTFTSDADVVTALNATCAEYTKIIATFQGSGGGYATNAEALESYLASAARLAATSTNAGTIATQINALYTAGYIDSSYKLTSSYASVANSIAKSLSITSVTQFIVLVQFNL